MVRRSIGALAGVLVTLLVAAPATFAACPQTTLADIEDEVMCTVCGTTLGLATEAPQAQRERAFVVERIERCESKDEIKAALVAEFGSEVLATPEEEGFGLAAYAVPLAVLIGGLTLVGLTAVRWRRSRRVFPSGEGPRDDQRHPVSAHASARLESDLERYDL
jgi:cytochrome c-type biogenesis protein CcmH